MHYTDCTFLSLRWLFLGFCSKTRDLVTKLDSESSLISNGITSLCPCHQSQLAASQSACIFHHMQRNSNHKLVCDSRISPYHPNPPLSVPFPLSWCVFSVSFFLFFLASLIYYFVFICIPDKILRKERRKMFNNFMICIFGFWTDYEPIIGILMGLYQQLKTG